MARPRTTPRFVHQSPDRSPVPGGLRAARREEESVIDGKTVVLVATGALLGASSTLTAQHWGRERTPQDGACFYEDADYRGDYFCARTGESLGSLPSGMNDRISSIRIFGRAEVTIFKDSHYEGSSRRIDYDVRNLKSENWNDRISSVRVRSSSSHGSTGHSSDHGASGRHGDADRIVRRAYEDILDREPDAAGLRLYRGRIIDDGWSEAQVCDALRSSPEFRQKNTMTRAKAEEIVREAYRSVLGREPDAGSRGYVDRVLRDKWTRQDVERELRKSPEYRNRQR
jgi:hypothetical protein